jgi:hypothetical protein
MAEIIRSCIDDALENHEPTRAELYARAARVVGRIEDREDASDLSQDHDAYLFREPA